MELDGYAHWVGEGSDRGVIVDTRGVQGVEEINEPVVYEFFQIEDKLTNCSWDFSRVVPPENVNDGALINGVVRIYDLWSKETEERIDGDKDDTDGVMMNGTSPLEVVICCDGKGLSNKSFPEGRERTIVGLVN